MIAALIYLGIAAEKPDYFTAGIIFGLVTLALGMLKKENYQEYNEMQTHKPSGISLWVSRFLYSWIVLPAVYVI